MRRLLIIAVLFLPVALQAQVIPTNEWVSLWSDHSVLDFSSMPVGSVVRAYDPQGVLCGEFTATASGAYGLMPVYRDDVTTAGIDEGAEPGDVISFTIDDVPAIPFGPDAAVWTANGDIRRVNLAAGEADLDIKPGSCPNVLNAKTLNGDSPANARSMRGGALPVAVLGTTNLDVHDIDLASLRLEGVEPVRHSYEDVAAPVAAGGECDCSTGGPDGFTDLTLKFRRTEIIATLGAFSDGQQRVLGLSGTLVDGTPLRASDCVGMLAKSPREPGLPSLSNSGVVAMPAAPNPFNPVTRIRYVLPTEAYVRLTVYDVTGRVVDHLVAHVQPAGEHVVAWDAGTNPSGIYFYRLEVGRFSETRKLILLK